MTERLAQTGDEGHPAATADATVPGPDGSPAAAAADDSAPALPDRYVIRATDGGHVLTCLESPTVTVHIESGLSLTDSSARQYPKGTIFLDGAAHTRPFVDAKRHVLNLDHHHGCVRPFTLATCEQALIMVRKGLDLQAREWTVYANQPDLDTVLAIWILLNHRQLSRGRPEILHKVIPLVRLEGCIDVHGLEMQDLCGFPEDFLAERSAEIGQLMARAAEIRREAGGGEVDPLEYAAAMLRAVDDLVYSPHDFEEVEKIEELARTDLPNDSFVVACRTDAPIYEAERNLRRLYGPRLGLLVLQKNSTTYTLRQVDPFLPATLEQVYPRLNLVDPAAGNSRSGNRWGGSEEIGGSPRRTGTALTVRQIIRAARSAYQRPTVWQRLGVLARIFSASALVMLIAWGAGFGAELMARRATASPLPDLVVDLPGAFSITLALLVGVALFLALRRGPGLVGWRRPGGLGWLYFAPAAVLGGLAGGVWLPGRAESLLATAAAAVLAAAAVEALFRGLAFGVLLLGAAPTDRGRWWPQSPVLFSALLYLFWTAMPFFALPAVEAGGITGLGPAVGLAGALLFGLACGWIRERSESLLPGLAVHLACITALLLATP